MKNTEQKIPALRFPEFSGEWEEKRLGEIADFYLGLTYTPTYRDEGVPFLSVKDITKGYISFEDTKFISQDEFDNSTNNAKPQKGDVIFGRVGTLGKPIVVNFDKPFCIFVSLGFLRLKYNTLNYYVKHWMDSDIFTKQVESKIAGSSQKNLNVGWLKTFKINVPHLDEQRQIADFLSAVDKRLQLLKDKKTKLEEYKRGVMQRIFSQELRFTRPDGSAYPDWEEKRLGEVSEILRGTSFPKSEITQNGKTKCIHYGELFTEYKELITSVVSRTDLENGIFSKKGDVLMPTSDVTPNGLARASALSIENVLLGGDINIIRIKGNLYYVFLSYFLNYDKYNIMRLVTGTTVKHIYASDIKGLKIPIPYLDEQRQIADFLSAIDDKVALLNQQIQSTEQYKKGLLQQMFV